MLDRVQDRSWLRRMNMDHGIHLHGAQRALSQWAIVDDYHTILDMHCRDAALLRYLSHKFSLRACGVARDAAAASRLMQSAPEAEFFCADKESLPCPDETFDAVFYQMHKMDHAFRTDFLREALRVLKSEGQMLIAVEGLPEAAFRFSNALGMKEKEDHLKPENLLQEMMRAGFDDVSYRMTQPFMGVAMGWKRN